MQVCAYVYDVVCLCVFCVQMCRSTHAGVCVHVEAIGQYQVSFVITLHPSFLRQGLSLNWQFRAL